jgi:hypothetical protein
MKKITYLISLVLTLFTLQIAAQVEGFETTAVGSVPTGWETYQSANDDPGFVVQDNTGYAHEGTHYLVHEGVNISSESTSWVVTNPISINNNYELKFYWRGKWSSAYNFTGVYISTSGNDPILTPGDYTLLEEFSPANYPNTWLQWNEAAFDLSAYSGQNVYIAFKYVGDFAHDFYIDDLNVAPIPYCEIPQNFIASNRDLTTIDVSWTPVTGVNEYEIVWGTSGFDPNAAGVNSAITSASSYQITGLTQSTDYDIYIRSICSSYNLSDWSPVLQVTTMGPPPSNNDCANPIPLTVYNFGAGAGNELAQSTLNATDSGFHPSCDNTGTNLDLWYSVTVPTGESGFQIITSGNNGGEIEAAVYDSCGGVELECFNNGNNKVVNGLAGGQTYIVQVWLDDFNSGNFNIVIESLPPAPTNDDCANAIPLTVYPNGGGAGNELAQSTLNAMDSGFHPSCDNTGTNLDLWYSVTVPTGEIGFQIITSGNNGSDIEAAVYDSCGGVELACFGNSNNKLVTGLTGGQTYIVQVWLDDFNSGNFNIVLEGLPPLPCTNATPLTVYPNGGGAGNELAQSTVNETDSGYHPSCDNSGVNLDIWYEVTVPAGENGFQIITSGPQGDYIEAAVYDGCIGSEIQCFSQSNSKLVDGLTGGQTYYLQVWLDDFNSGDFNIVLESLPSPPSNNDCANAIDLIPDTTCNPVYSSNFGATDSGVPAPSCANYQGGDLWFTVTVPSGGNIIVETSAGNSGNVTDTGMAVYEGDCNNLNEIDCDDDDGSGLFSKIILSGRTPGEVLYIRVWEYGNNSYGEIGICATIPPPPPSNDTCSNPINLTVYPSGGGAGNELSQSTLSASDSGVHPSCDNIGTNLDLWYTVTVPTNETGFVILTSGAAGSNIEAAVYDSCGGAELDCFSTGSSKTVTGLTGGQTYYVQVWHDDSNMGNFDIVIESLPTPPANDDCANAMNLTVYPSGGGTGNELSQSTLAASDTGVHPSCDNTGTNLDLWYTVTVPTNETGFVILTSGAAGSDIEAAVYDSCGGSEIDCFSPGSSKTVTGLTGGQTYIVQVWLDDFNSGNFNIVIESLPTPPTNDDCANAMNLTVYPSGGGAGNELSQSTLAASDSGVHPSCDNTGTNLDLWYTVTVPTNETGFVILTSGAAGSNIEAAVYDSCGGVELDCFTPGSSKTVTGLTGGQTYIVQVWLDSFNSGNFDIVIESLSSGSIRNNSIEGLSLFPNPAKNEFIIESNNRIIESVEVFTTSGQKVLNINPHNNKTKVNISQLSTGVYFVKIQAEGRINTYRLIKE